MNKVAKILDKARNVIETKGLFKGQLENYDIPNGPCCMLGALNRACGGVNRADTPWNQAVSVLEEVVPDNNIPVFNDSKSTTKAKVLKKFDEAISLALYGS